jgi:dipeptidyl-peptidase-4
VDSAPAALHDTRMLDRRTRAFALASAAILAAGGCASTGARAGAPGTAAAAAGAGAGAHQDSTAMHASKDSADADFDIEEVARRPLPGTSHPTAPAFSPDGTAVTFLFSENETLIRQLYAVDLATGARRLIVDGASGGVTEDSLSLEEKLRRERKRELGLGVTTYAWSRRGNVLLVPLAGGLSIKRWPDGALTQIVPPGDDPILDPQMSRDGRHVAFVRDAELYVVPTAGGAPRQITTGARGTGKTHGLAEFIAQEEMQRHQGFWWSWDGALIAYTEVDETHIPAYRIVHQGKDATGAAAQEDHGYPFAGAPNAVVRLGVVPAQGGRTVWMDLDMDGAARDPVTGKPDIYLARVHWLPDGRLLAQVQDRAQTRLDLVAFDPRTGKRQVLLTETASPWINLNDLFRPIENGPHAGGFLWGSERSGFQHLYLHDRSGKQVRPLTAGEWVVVSVTGVDEERGRVYFIATRDGVTERHLYAVSLDGGAPQRLTAEPGIHEVVLDAKLERFVDTHASVARPPRVTVRSLESGAVVTTIYDHVDERIAKLGLAPPELVTLQSRDGMTLHGAIYRPSPGKGQAPYPVIVSVYGGPHAQRVDDNWLLTVDMRAQYLRSLGFLVFKLDNRGAAWRGLAFEAPLHRDMGNIEVQDQVDGVRWLVAQGLGDPGRVGIYGWSYGGYMAAMCLMRAPDTFHVAVAGAPVTHWDGYDTHYTERYMGTPQDNPRGYAESSVMRHVPAMRGKLLLVHGLLDENVHFRHTARLINALIQHRKDYRLLLFPDERHMPRGAADRVYMEEQVRDFFLQHL